MGRASVLRYRITQSPVPFADSTELITSMLNVLGFHARGINDLLDRTHGQILFDNAGTVYTGSSAVPPALLAAINDPESWVKRFTATPAAQNYLENYFQPTGDLRIPVLSLHTTRDPAVPFGHETALASIVSGAGTSDLLRQRAISRYGHCTFTLDEMVRGVQDLAAWAETGVPPTE